MCDAPISFVTLDLEEFLVLVRNLLEPLRPPTSSKYWTVSSVESIPLESDSSSLEYLASHNYDVQAAYFALCCELGYGKGENPSSVFVGSYEHKHSTRRVQLAQQSFSWQTLIFPSTLIRY